MGRPAEFGGGPAAQLRLKGDRRLCVDQSGTTGIASAAAAAPPAVPAPSPGSAPAPQSAPGGTWGPRAGICIWGGWTGGGCIGGGGGVGNWPEPPSVTPWPPVAGDDSAAPRPAPAGVWGPAAGP